jgi:transcriptional repressor NrdR
MTCPFCAHRQDRVIDSRESKEGDVIRRRRECLKCQRRFTTYERSDEVPYMVVKRDGRREKFDRPKVLEGLIKACEKRPVAMAKLRLSTRLSRCSPIARIGRFRRRPSVNFS